MTLSEVTWDWRRTPRKCNEAVMGDMGLDSLHTTHVTLLDIMNKKCIERLIGPASALHLKNIILSSPYLVVYEHKQSTSTGLVYIYRVIRIMSKRSGGWQQSCRPTCAVFC